MPEGDLTAYLTSARVEDLWHVCAVLRGDSVALQAFDRTYRARMALAVRRVAPQGFSEDDVVQIAWTKLLVGDETQGPALATYAGRGSLLGWLRLLTMRIALDLRRQGRHEVPLDDELVAWPDPSANPALAMLRQRYTADFKRAFEEAMASLEPRARNVLRQQVLYRLTLDQIAGMYRVHRSAVARWLADARLALLTHTRESLSARLGTGRSEVESLIAVLHSQLDVSIERLLGTDISDEE